MASKQTLTYQEALKVLDLEENASKDDIKKAYKNLARKYHPDKNSHPNAKENFQEVSAAYRKLVHPGNFYNEDDGDVYDDEVYQSSDEEDNYGDDSYMFFALLQEIIFRQRFYQHECMEEDGHIFTTDNTTYIRHRSQPTFFGPSAYSARYHRKSATVNADEEDDELYDFLRKKQTEEDEEDLDPDEVVKKYKTYEEWHEAKKSKKKTKFTLPPYPRPLTKKQQMKQQYMREKQIQEIHVVLMKTKAAQEEKERARLDKIKRKDETKVFQRVATEAVNEDEKIKPKKPADAKHTRHENPITDTKEETKEPTEANVKHIEPQQTQYDQLVQNYRQQERERNLSEHRQIIANKVEERKIAIKQQQQQSKVRQNQQANHPHGQNQQANHPHGQNQQANHPHDQYQQNLKPQQLQSYKKMPLGSKNTSNQNTNRKSNSSFSKVGSKMHSMETRRTSEAIPMPPPPVNAWLKGGPELRAASKSAGGDSHLIPASVDEEEEMLRKAIELSIREEEEQQRYLLSLIEQEKVKKYQDEKVEESLPYRPVSENNIMGSGPTRCAVYDETTRVISFRDSQSVHLKKESLSESSVRGSWSSDDGDKKPKLPNWEKYGVRPKSAIHRRQASTGSVKVPKTNDLRETEMELKYDLPVTSKQNLDSVWDIEEVNTNSMPGDEKLIDPDCEQSSSGSAEAFFRKAMVPTNEKPPRPSGRKAVVFAKEVADHSKGSVSGQFIGCDNIHQRHSVTPSSNNAKKVWHNTFSCTTGRNSDISFIADNPISAVPSPLMRVESSNDTRDMNPNKSHKPTNAGPPTPKSNDSEIFSQRSGNFSHKNVKPTELLESGDNFKPDGPPFVKANESSIPPFSHLPVNPTVDAQTFTELPLTANKSTELTAPPGLDINRPPSDSTYQPNQSVPPFSMLPPPSFLGALPTPIAPAVNPMLVLANPFLTMSYLQTMGMVCPPMMQPGPMQHPYFGMNPMMQPMMGMTTPPMPFVCNNTSTFDEGEPKAVFDEVAVVAPVFEEVADSINFTPRSITTDERKKEEENACGDGQSCEVPIEIETKVESESVNEVLSAIDLASSPIDFDANLQDFNSFAKASASVPVEISSRPQRSQFPSKPRGCQNPSIKYSQVYKPHRGNRQDHELYDDKTSTYYDTEDTRARRTRSAINF